MTFISGEVVEIKSQSSSLDDFEDTTPSDDSDLRSFIQIEDEFLINGNTVKKALAVQERYTTVDGVLVDSQSEDISIGEKEEKTWQRTTFWLFPKEYVILENSSGLFALPQIERALKANVENARFDLEQIVQDYQGQWMGSIEERKNNVESAVMYGEDIENDRDMGSPFKSSDKNQIGPWIKYGGTDLKVRVGKSWFQVLKPGDYTRYQHLELFDGLMKNYLR